MQVHGTNKTRPGCKSAYEIPDMMAKGQALLISGKGMAEEQGEDEEDIELDEMDILGDYIA
jgi:hypothetical protein